MMNMQLVTKALSLLCVTILLSGCATMADSVNAKGTGQFRLYDKDFNAVWSAVLEVVNGSKLKLISENMGEGQILAQRGMSALSYGENVAVFVQRQESDEKTRVEVVSKKALSTTVFATNWETKIFEELDVKLK
jgi:major membrane immunogen (membrane-anchored lipoprotein)